MNVRCANYFSTNAESNNFFSSLTAICKQNSRNRPDILMYLMGYSDRALINPYVCLSVCLYLHPSVRPSGRPFSFNRPSGCARRNFDFRSTFPLDHDETLRRVADRRLTHRRRRRNEKCGQMDQNEYLTRHDITRLSTKLSQQTGREIFLQFGTQHSTRSREVDDTSTRYPRYR